MTLSRAALLYGLCLAFATAAQAATIVWTNTAGGDWTTAANWNPNQVPGSSDTAVITNGGTYAVALSTSISVAGITLGVPSGTDTQTLAWTGGTLTGCALAVASNGVLAISGSNQKTLRRSTLNNAGTVTWTGSGDLMATADGFSQSVLITNLAGGLFGSQSDAALSLQDWGYALTFRFHNAGTFRKTGGTGTSSFTSQCQFINTGTVGVQQGALQFPNGFTSSGTFDLATDTKVHLDGGTFAFGGGSLKSGAGELLVDGGNVTLAGTAPSLSWTGGTLVGSDFTVASNATLAISGSTTKTLLRSALNNAGTVTWAGSGNLLATTDGFSQSVLITNLVGGVFEVQNDASLSYQDYGYGQTARFHNAGTLRKIGGTGTTTFASQSTFVNTGTVTVQQGTIVFPTFRNDGTLTVQTGGSAGFPLGFVNNGVFDLAAGMVVNLTGGNYSFGPASQLTGGGQLVIPSGTATLNGTVPSLSWTGGTLADSLFTVASNATLAISGSSQKTLLRSTLNNAGTVTWTGTGAIQAEASGFEQSVLITNLAGGLFEIQNDAGLSLQDWGFSLTFRFHNAGTLRKTGGSGNTSFASQCQFINTGTVSLQQGALQFPNGFTSSGTFDLATNATVHLDGGTFAFGGGSLKSGAGELLVDGGNVTLAGTAPSLSWTGGTLVGSDFTVASNATLAISGSTTKTLLRSTLNNAGTVTWAGSGDLLATADGFGQSVLITNLAEGVFEIQNDASLSYQDYGHGQTARFHNAGTLRKTGGTGTTTFASQSTFVNTGTVTVQQGTIVFPTFRNDGTLAVQSGGSATFPLGFVNNGTFDLHSGMVVNLTGGNYSFGPASQLTGGGQLVIPSGTVTLNGTVPSFSWTGGTLADSVLTVASNATLAISGGNQKTLVRSTLNNAGTVTWTGTGAIQAEASGFSQSVLITNLAGGVFEIQNDASLSYQDWGYALTFRFHNAGTLRKTGGSGNTSFASQLAFSSTGFMEAQNGTLAFAGNETRIGGVVIFGLTSPTVYGRVSVTSQAKVHAVLSAALVNAGGLNAGDQFPVLNQGTRLRNAVVFAGRNLGGSLVYDPVIGTSTLTLVLRAAEHPTPPVVALSYAPQLPAFVLMEGAAGQTFRFDASTDLTTWTSLETNAASAGVWEFNDPNAPAYPSRFYRGQQTGP